MLRFFLFVMCAIGAFASQAPGARAELVELETKTALRGVWLFHDAAVKRIRIQPVFVAGEADFNGPEGLSHYLEHLMYRQAAIVGSKNYHGRTGNAWVNGFITTYYNTAERAELDDLFIYARQLLKPPNLDEKFMLSERDVVKREYDFRVVENPDRRAAQAAWRELNCSNPAGRSVIGTLNSIGSLTLDHARSFHRQFYHPANMVLLISGPIGMEEAVRRVETAFGVLEAGPENEQNWRNAPTAGELDKHVTMRDRYVEAHAVKHQAVADWTTGDRMNDIYTVFMTEALLQSALPGSPSKALRTDAFVLANYSVYLSTIVNKRAELFLQARPDEGISPEQAIQAIRAVMKDIGEKGISEESFERIRKRLLKAAVRLQDDADFALKRAAVLATYGVSPNSNANHIKRLEMVSRSDVNALLRALGTPKRQVSTLMFPEASQ